MSLLWRKIDFILSKSIFYRKKFTQQHHESFGLADDEIIELSFRNVHFEKFNKISTIPRKVPFNKWLNWNKSRQFSWKFIVSHQSFLRVFNVNQLNWCSLAPTTSIHFSWISIRDREIKFYRIFKQHEFIIMEFFHWKVFFFFGGTLVRHQNCGSHEIRILKCSKGRQLPQC